MIKTKIPLTFPWPWKNCFFPDFFLTCALPNGVTLGRVSTLDKKHISFPVSFGQNVWRKCHYFQVLHFSNIWVTLHSACTTISVAVWQCPFVCCTGGNAASTALTYRYVHLLDNTECAARASYRHYNLEGRKMFLLKFYTEMSPWHMARYLPPGGVIENYYYHHLWADNSWQQCSCLAIAISMSFSVWQNC